MRFDYNSPRVEVQDDVRKKKWLKKRGGGKVGKYKEKEGQEGGREGEFC